MNQITWNMETGEHQPHITICYGAVYIFGDINKKFLAIDETELKNWTNIFLQKNMANIWRMDKI